MRVLHSLGFVHNDLKLDNILVGYKDPSTIYLIDFGVSQRFIDDNGEHIQKKTEESFSGNFQFASLNACCRTVKTRRDDIQSLMNIMIYLLNENQLPWSDFVKMFKDKDYVFGDYLNERLDIKYTKELIQMCPNPLKKILKQILTLRFNQEPPYDELIELLKQQIVTNVKIGPDLQPLYHNFEWNQNFASKLKASILKEQYSHDNLDCIENILSLNDPKRRSQNASTYLINSQALFHQIE